MRGRGENPNPRLPTGDIEVACVRLEIFSAARPPPFAIADEVEAGEEVRLRHRYIDLRRPRLTNNLLVRHRLGQLVRRLLDGQGFVEVETPCLVKSTPEGARDYVVPSRVQPGAFFALPQSPQLFKQLLMVAGLDRYFQIVRCFRDEDLRAERQPEFTQVDLEMSFVTQEQVMAVAEGLLCRAWEDILGSSPVAAFPRMTYAEAMRRFGSDAPDLRFGLELVDLADLVAEVPFEPFAGPARSGGRVAGMNLREAGAYSRRELDQLAEAAVATGAPGLAWARLKDDGDWQSPLAKFLPAATRAEIGRRLDMRAGDVAVFAAGSPEQVARTLGTLRRGIARDRGLGRGSPPRFLWVTDFPLLAWDAEAGRHVSLHHPFTAPHPDDLAKLEAAPTAVRAQAYDVVLDGIEIGGGSIRIHDPGLQARIFAALGIGEAEQRSKFGFLLDALAAGAPPHGGLALGLDRVVMAMCGTASIRDVIAFPKTQRQSDLMLEAPSPLDPAQLAELHLRGTAAPPRPAG